MQVLALLKTVTSCLLELTLQRQGRGGAVNPSRAHSRPSVSTFLHICRLNQLQYCEYYEKIAVLSGPVQFKLMLFKGQLWFSTWDQEIKLR